nr:Chain A, C-terminal peptide from Serine acetyltransferase [Salmonella enterica subsp. enterica serovar Typhimurium str. LT2]4ZU6_B Chain B, C-terminal peptide from Serine acetyltransferase [Salmonella enterica subsp. enterica serovar Typhimurium str. LT2]5DBE_A Chain A, C-terminal peptide from Serine acetyltransferase [Salmonella enterica subsp. enterica serovar Typhimurium str. LT2]
HHTFEYGDGI